MFCSQCGDELPSDARFCPNCGLPVIETGHTDTTAAIPVDVDPVVPADLPSSMPGVAMLVVVRGPAPGTRFLLDRDVTTIGRHPDANLFLDDVTVSRNHVEIRREGDRLELRDLGSLNGTYVGQDRVDAHVLTTGDEIQVGRFRLMYLGPEAT